MPKSKVRSGSFTRRGTTMLCIQYIAPFCVAKRRKKSLEAFRSFDM